MRIAVCLLTCDRAEYTRRTLASFRAQHPTASETFVLVHGDDGSVEGTNKALAIEHGFETVVVHDHRQGARALRIEMVQAAATRGAEWILFLENDWEWVRPFPFALHAYLVASRPDVYMLRLYGQYKERNKRRPCLAVHVGKGRQPVKWTRLAGAPEPAEVGNVHWGAPPAVTRLAEALKLHQPGTAGAVGSSDLREMQLSGTLSGLVARVVENVVYHFGDETTDGLARARPRKVARPVVRRPVNRAASTARPPLYTPAWQATRAWTAQGSTACLNAALAICGRPQRMLDVGCGDGHLVGHAASLGIQALGVDLSVTENLSERLVRHDLTQPLALTRVERLETDGPLSITSKPALFDLVLCWEVAEHLPAEAADTLCASLSAHLLSTGTLLFTAAKPGQGGQGHINCQPPEYWRTRLEAIGLTYDAGLSRRLSSAWRAAAPKTPWYGANIQAFHGCAWTPPNAIDPSAESPRIAITMRTANRRPKGPNYVGSTVRRLVDQGIPADAIQVCATDPDVSWLVRELDGVRVSVHIPNKRLTPNENGLAQIANLDPSRYDWVLLLEDDLEFCADFLGSLKRWLVAHGRADRHLFRFFAFGVPGGSGRAAYDDKTLDRYRGSQAVALRMDDALDFLAWSRANLLTWGGFRGNAKIAFDKLLASWHQKRWPGVPAVLSAPFLVRHIGDVSSLHPKAQRNDRMFGGAHWSYR